MKQKINPLLLLSAKNYALKLRHPIFNELQAKSYQEIAAFSSNITKKFDRVLVHGIYPDLMLKYLNKDIKEIYLAGPLDSNKELPENVSIVENQQLMYKQTNAFDAIFSSLKIHEQTQKNIRRYQKILIPDGALIGSTWTQNTLQQLKWAYLLAENQRSGGISPKVLNFQGMGNIGHLLAMEKFNLPTILAHKIEINVESVIDLLTMLQVTGASGYLHGKRKGAYKDVLLAMSALYDTEFHSQQKNTVKSTFEMAIFIGWKQDPSQTKPLQRGQEIGKDFLDKLKEEDPQLESYRITEGSDQPQKLQ